MPDCPAIERVELSDLGPGLRTGDLVLFAGRGLVGDTIRLFTRSYWSHVGMVYRAPAQGRLMLLESTNMSSTPDLIRGRPVSGVALVPLAVRIEAYRGAVAIRQRLGEPPGAQRLRMLDRMVRRLLHRPYKNYVLTLARDLCTGYQLAPDRSGLFCSELVAELYRRLGWLPRETRASLYVPAHFASPRLSLLDGEAGPMQQVREMPSTASVVPVVGNPATAPRNAGHERLLLPQSHGG